MTESAQWADSVKSHPPETFEKMKFCCLISRYGSVKIGIGKGVDLKVGGVSLMQIFYKTGQPSV